MRGFRVRAPRSTYAARLAGVACTAMAALALAAPASAEQGDLLGYARSSSMTSNTTNVINGQPQPGMLLPLNGPRLVVRSVPLGTIAAGETIKALSEVEVTNDLVTQDAGGTNIYHDAAVELVLVLAESPTATTGIEIGEEQGTFVTPQVHHWTFEKSAALETTEELGDRHLNLVMSAHSPEELTACWTFPRSSLPSPQHPRACGVDVDYNRGHLSVLRTGQAGAVSPDAVPFSLEQFSGQSLPEASPADAPITYAGQTPELIVAMARPVGALGQGDVLTAHSEIEVDARDVVRSDVNCNIGVATRLYLAPSPDSLAGAVAIGAEGGNNFTGRGAREIKTLEQGIVPSSATVELNQDHPAPMYVLLRLWTVGNSACAAFGNGIRAKLDQAASFMHVMRYRPEPDAGLVSRTADSGDDSELASELDVIDQTPVSVYSQRLSALAPGDLIEALAEVEVESDDHRAAVRSGFVLADSPTATTGTPLGVANQTELNPFMASLPIHRSTAWTVPAGVTGTRYLNLVMSGEHLQSLASATDDQIEIAPDGGRLLVEHLRPVDNDPPEGAISAGPIGLVSDSTPEFTFSSDEDNSTFECRLDSSDPNPFLPCAGVYTPPALGEGPHTLELRAVDRAGNADPTPVGRLFIVDTVAPAAPAIAGSDPPSPANDNQPRLAGSAEAGTSVRVHRSAGCDGAVEWQGSASAFAAGFTVSVPDDLTQAFSATATDAAGNTSACGAPYLFSEDSRPPQTSITAGPRGKGAKRSARFSFGADEGGSRFECSLDASGFAPCGSPALFRRLKRGPHTLRVRALDAAGNADLSPAKRGWRVVKKKRRR